MDFDIAGLARRLVRLTAALASIALLATQALAIHDVT